MRILGTTKRKTRSLLLIEQVLLGIAGLVFGVFAMFVYKGRDLAAITSKAALFAALYFAAIVASALACSALATRHSALELLQTKE